MLNPLVGTTGLHPWDSTVTHDLLRSLNPLYMRMSVNYGRWQNEIQFYDQQYALNSMYQIILCLETVPLDQIETFVPMILDRYKVWGVTPVNEDENAARTAQRILEFHRVVPEARLIGPDLQNNYSPVYVDELVRLGAIGCLDIIAMHDYFAVPSTPESLVWYRPDEIVTYWGLPNLPARIAWMKSYVLRLRKKFTDGPKVMITEYGTYINSVEDSVRAAQISKATDVPFMFCVPNEPAGLPGSILYAQALYSNNNTEARWAPPMEAYLVEINTPKVVVPPPVFIPPPVVVSPRRIKLSWLKKFWRFWSFW